MTPPKFPEDDDQNLSELLEQHLEDRNWEKLRETTDQRPAPEMADALHDLDHDDRHTAFRALSTDLAADILPHFTPERAHRLLEDLDDDERREVLGELAPDDRVQILEELPDDASDELMAFLDDQAYREARKLLEYPDESVGRLMNPRSLVIRPDWTIPEALDYIRKEGKHHEIVNRVFVLDDESRLVDVLELRTLILADRDSRVEDHTDEKFLALSPYDDREEAVRALQRYDVVALPVIDADGVFLGIVTVDDILDVAEKEFTEDFHQHGAVRPLERNYSESSTLTLFGSRIGWLLVLILVNLVSSGVIAFFEETLESIIALAFFIPLLIDSGGNTGAQSATMMVRAIATDDVKMTEWFKAFSKELGVGALLGVTMGLASAALGLFRGDLTLGIIVGLSMAGIVMVANIVGTLLPFLLTRFKIDPAVASSPLITTIADATGLFIYFGIATLFLQAGYVPV